MTKSKISRKLVSGIGAFAIIAAACGSGSTNDTYSDDEPSSASADGDPADNAENEGSSSNQSTDASQSVADSEEQIQSVDDFEDYAIGQGLPENWSTYGNASGDIDLVAAGDDTSSETKRATARYFPGVLTQTPIRGLAASEKISLNHRTGRASQESNFSISVVASEENFSWRLVRTELRSTALMLSDIELAHFLTGLKVGS